MKLITEANDTVWELDHHHLLVVAEHPLRDQKNKCSQDPQEVVFEMPLCIASSLGDEIHSPTW